MVWARRSAEGGGGAEQRTVMRIRWPRDAAAEPALHSQARSGAAAVSKAPRVSSQSHAATAGRVTERRRPELGPLRRGSCGGFAAWLGAAQPGHLSWALLLS